MDFVISREWEPCIWANNTFATYTTREKPHILRTIPQRVEFL